MSIDPTILAILRDLPPFSEPTREVPPGVAADLRDASGKDSYTIIGLRHLGQSTLESPDGLEQLCAESHEYEVVWVDGGRSHFKCYKTIVLVGYRRPVAHLRFDRTSKVFTTSDAISALWATLRSEGWQEV